MNLNLEWVKKHKLAAGAAVLVGLLVLFVLLRKSGSSGSGLDALAANQQQGQLQLAQLNAQEAGQQNQLQAQLASQEYSTQAQTQQSQDQLAASIFSEELPYELQMQQIQAQNTRETALIPLEEQLVTYGTSGKAHGSLIGLNENELALLAGESAGGLAPVGSPYEPQGSPSGFSLSLPGGIGIGTQLGTGLFA